MLRQQYATALATIHHFWVSEQVEAGIDIALITVLLKEDFCGHLEPLDDNVDKSMAALRRLERLRLDQEYHYAGPI